MLNAFNSHEFYIYTQILREAKPGDEYTRLKVIKDRAKVAKFFNVVLPTREVILSWSENGEKFSTVATLDKTGYNNLAPLPEIPDEFDLINGRKAPAQKHIHFYSKPQMIPTIIELDSIENFIVRVEGIDELLKR